MGQRASTGIALGVLSLWAFLNVSPALAQAGSTGGAIGKQDKSISGDQAVTPSPAGERRKPAQNVRPNESPDRACARLSADIGGTWSSQSPSAVSENIRPTGCNFTATLSTQLFNHSIRGHYAGNSTFSITIDRINRMTGCATVMSGSMKVTSGTQMLTVITHSDGKCDLPANFAETRTWTR